jgi:hypothetical protein
VYFDGELIVLLPPILHRKKLKNYFYKKGVTVVLKLHAGGIWTGIELEFKGEGINEKR